MEDRMEIITYTQLKTNIDVLIKIEKLKIIEKINEHTCLYITGIVDEKHKDSYVKNADLEQNIKVYYEHEGEKILFQGIIKNVEIQFIQGIYYLNLEGVSYSYQLDMEKKNRSFQNKGMKYNTLFKDIVSNYRGGDIMDSATNGANLDKLLIQYQETDWEFMKRCASHFHAGILPEPTYAAPKITIGFRTLKEWGDLIEYQYTISKNLKDSEPQLRLEDCLAYKIHTNKPLGIGDCVNYLGEHLYVRGVVSEMVQGCLEFTCGLTTERGFIVPLVHNKEIAGVSIYGTVLECISDRVKVHLSIDNSQKKETAWEFPYTTHYSAEGSTGWYCMPELEDTVSIYFPTKEEASAIGVECIRRGRKSSDKIMDPKIKYFRTAEGKELKFSPEGIEITCCNDNGKNVIYIKLDQRDGIEIKSSKPINFYSEKGISLQAEEEIEITAEEKIQMNCKTSEIKIDDNIEINGKDVRIN